MQFTAMPTVDDERFVLRPLAANDLETWAGYLMQPHVLEHTSWNVKSPEDLRTFVWQESTRDPDSAIRFVVARRDSNRLVGTIGFHFVQAVHRSAELAYDYAPEVWGQGLASSLCRSMTAWGHASARLLRVQATVLETNARSIRMLERSGFEREGMLRSFRLVRGTPGNFYMYSHVVAPTDATT